MLENAELHYAKPKQRHQHAGEDSRGRERNGGDRSSGQCEWVGGWWVGVPARLHIRTEGAERPIRQVT